MRLFNEEAGHEFLRSEGVPEETIARLDLLGISCICNLAAAIKTAKYYELGPRDIIFLPQTDSMELYQSRMAEQQELHGDYTEIRAARHFARYLRGLTIDHMRELNHYDRKSLHNFKYFTWVEQQGRSAEELRELWDPDFWESIWPQAAEWDELIRQFNALVESPPAV